MVTAIEAHRGMMVSRMHDIRGRLVPQVAEPQVVLTVDGGLHDGLSRTVTGCEIRVGSGPDDDILLLDDGLDAGHVTLALNTTIFGTALIASGAGTGVTVNGHAVEPGKTSQPYRLPAQLRIHDVTLDIDARHEAPRPPGRARVAATAVWRRWWIKWPVLVFACLVFLAIPRDIYSSRDAQRFALRQSNGPLAADPPAGTDGPAGDTLAGIEARIAEEPELSRFLSVSGGSGGVIYVTGSIPVELQPDWRAIQAWHDGIDGSRPLLSRVSVAPVLSELPAIASVRLGETPQLIFSAGTRAGIGDTIGGDWTVTTIDAEGMQLDRGPETIAIEF